MRILLCVHVYPPSVGGIEKSTSVLAEHYCRQGASVTVVTQAQRPRPRQQWVQRRARGSA